MWRSTLSLSCRALHLDGKVVAVADIVAPPPWELRESSEYRGRYYFFNLQSGQALWELDMDLFDDAELQAAQSQVWLPPIPTRASAPSSVLLIPWIF